MEEEKKKKHISESITKVVRCVFVLLQLDGRSSSQKEKEKRRDWQRAREERGKEARKTEEEEEEEEDGEVPLSSSFRRARAGLDICILRRALGSQSLRCVALIPDFATRGMTLTHRRTKRV